MVSLYLSIWFLLLLLVVAFFSNFFSTLWFMFWSSSPSGLACLWLYHQANIKLLSGLRSQKTTNIMHVSLVRCYLRHGTDVPLRMCKQAAAPEIKKILGQVEIKIYIKNSLLNLRKWVIFLTFKNDNPILTLSIDPVNIPKSQTAWYCCEFLKLSTITMKGTTSFKSFQN